jgi:hypothetical protein
MKKSLLPCIAVGIAITAELSGCNDSTSLRQTIPATNSQQTVITPVTQAQGEAIIASLSNDTFRYIDQLMDQFHLTVDVYTDADSAGNHFVARGKISSIGGYDQIPSMNERVSTNCHSGSNCIQAEFIPRNINWGGWVFMNGVLHGNERTPTLNWGDEADAGFNLSGATTLSFWARGDNGEETVEFFAFGLGRDDYGYPTKPYPDSPTKVSTGAVRLTSDWKLYSIYVGDLDLSYVLGGFGWIAAAQNNSGNSIKFYLDDIKYNKARVEEPRLIVSFATSGNGKIDDVMRSVAFTYDNAVALIAYVAKGDNYRAKLLADGLLLAIHNDRFFHDNRVRNAYKANDIELFSGWYPHGQRISTGMPGFTCKDEKVPDQYTWCEDEFQVSTHTGNVAWTMLALLAYYEKYGGDKYLATAKDLGEWVAINCTDERQPRGYTGGFEGWERSASNAIGQQKLTYKATEHNIDLYAAFLRIYEITKLDTWRQRSDIARSFVLSMWDDHEGKFWTGTNPDGITINKEVVPVDIQAWAIQGLGSEGMHYLRALTYVESHHLIEGGFDFNEDRDGIWYEGTSQMAVSYYITGNLDKWKRVTEIVRMAQKKSGAIPATNKSSITTGFNLPNSKEPWLYYAREHLGATGWFALAQLGVNPFAAMPHPK